MKRFAIALVCGILFAASGMSTAQADYGYPSYRSSYYGSGNYGHSGYGYGGSSYRYRTYRAPAYDHCDPAPTYRYSRGY